MGQRKRSDKIRFERLLEQLPTAERHELKAEVSARLHYWERRLRHLVLKLRIRKTLEYKPRQWLCVDGAILILAINFAHPIILGG